MGKFLDKIKEKRFEAKQIEDQISYVCKLKKINDTDKFKKCLDLIGYYFDNNHVNRVEYETYEEFFEKFYVDGVRDEKKFEECFNFMEDSVKSIIARIFLGSVNDLKDVKKQELTENEKNIYNKILECVKVHFPENFDYKHYALFVKDVDAYRNDRNVILNEVFQNYKKEQEKKNGEELVK